MRILPLNANTRTRTKKTGLLSQPQNNNYRQSICNNTNPLQYMPSYQMISFGAKPTDFEQQRMEHDQQLLNLQARKTQIMEKIERVRQYDVEERKAHYQKLAKQELSELSVWTKINIFSTAKEEEIVNKYANQLRTEIATINSLVEQFDDLKEEWALIERGETNIEKALSKLGELEKNWNEFEAEKQLKAQKAQKINEILQSKGGLNSRIAGYEEQKKAVVSNLVEPIVAEIDSVVEQKVPNSLLLYGATGTGKTTFTEALIDTIKFEAGKGLKKGTPDDVKVHVETLVIPKEGDFLTIITDKLGDARNRYNDSKTGDKLGTRTVYVVNEVEKHLDKSKIGASDSAVRDNIDYMKSVLDECAKLPNPNNNRAFATTFYLTTNYPMKIHDDILYREGKIGLKIPLNPAEKDDIAAILKFYVDKASKLIKETHPNLDINPNSVPYDKLGEMLRPNEEEGAFSNDILQSMVMRRGSGNTAGALQRYQENPENSFASHLSDIALTEPRDIEKDRFDMFTNIYKEVEKVAKRKIDNVKLLLQKEFLGTIGAADKEALELLRRTGKL